MIIKIIPETEFEKQKWQEVEHTGVKDFHVFGNKRETDGDLVDFHAWNGKYRYLESNLYYFLQTISEERKSQSVMSPEIDLKPPVQPKPSFAKPHMIKKGTLEDSKVQVIDVGEMTKKMLDQSASNFKKGLASEPIDLSLLREESKIAEEKNNGHNDLVDISPMPKPSILQFPKMPPPIDDVERDESKGAED